MIKKGVQQENLVIPTDLELQEPSWDTDLGVWGGAASAAEL